MVARKRSSDNTSVDDPAGIDGTAGGDAKARDPKTASGKTASGKSRDGKAGNAATQAAAERPRRRRRRPVIVGIAASAGGLEALSQLIGALPEQSAMAYVVVQHLAPQHRSMLTQLLGRQTKLKVVEIVDGVTVEPNIIYITPPNHDLDIQDAALFLRTPHAAVGPKPSADYFLASLAEDQGENSAGVILSGTGSDGAHGIRAIKAAGGITYAQNRETAKYDGMPQAAVDSGCVDFVMTPAEIAHELTAQVSSPRRATLTADEEGKDALVKVLTLLKRRHAMDFTSYKKSTIGRRVKRRMAACRVETLEDYLKLVEETPTELDQLRNDILISVTSFFRDPDAFDALAQVLPDILKDKRPGDTIRVWVPACASGEEAYSLAIQMMETLGGDLFNYQLQIFATDVDIDALARARRGIYPDASVKTLSKEMLARHFTAHGGQYQVNKSVRDMIVFAKHDLIQDPPFLRIDLISCRNLLIYFNAALQAKVINIFHYALNPGKHLMLGKSESVGSASSLFHTLDKKWKLYRRMGEARAPLGEIANVFQRKGMSAGGRQVRPMPARERTMGDLVQDALVESFAPPTAVVDGDGRILHIHGDVSLFLQLRSGAPDLNVFSMVRPEYKSEVRTAMLRCQQSGGPARSLSVRPGGASDEAERVRVSVAPLAGAEGMFLLCFERTMIEVGAPQEPGGGVGGESVRLREMEQELTATKENLQTVVEELETSNEELQSLNEEFQASNEELQSSNEELETSNEELQSTNEELTTVNEELQTRTGELASANADLETIMGALGFPLVVVDRDLRITRFNSSSKLVFDLLPDDVGQMITAVPCHLDIPNFRSRLRAVLDQGQTFETQVDQPLRSYWVRFISYDNEQGEPAGVVMIFVDNTRLRQSEKMLRESEGRFHAIADSIREVFWLQDREGRLAYVSPAAEALFGVPRETLLDQPELFFAGCHPEDRPALDEARERMRDGADVSLEFRMTPDPTTGAGRRIWIQSFAVAAREHAQEGMVAGIAVDITRIREVENQLRHNHAPAADAETGTVGQGPSATFLATVAEDLRTPLSSLTGFAEMRKLAASGRPTGDRTGDGAEDAGNAEDAEDALHLRLMNIISERGGDLLELISNMLHLSRLDAGDVRLDETEVSLADLLRTCARHRREDAERARSGLTLSLPENLPRVTADEPRLRKVIDTLLCNAIRFSVNGGPIGLSAHEEEDGSLSFTVCDSGIGMREEDIAHALDPRRAAHPIQGRRQRGAGLGLPIAKRLVELHGGTLAIASREGKGTSVTVTLPPTRVLDKADAPPEELRN